MPPRWREFAGPISKHAAAILSAIALLAAVGLEVGKNARAAERQPFVPLDDSLVLSQSSVHALAQDRDGYLWIGTQAGLDRYDGYTVRSWRSDPDDPDSLSGSLVRDLLVADDNTLWVATDRGLDRLDPDLRRVTRLPVQLDDGTRIRNRFLGGTLTEDDNGDIYAVAHEPPMVVRWRSGQQALKPVPVGDARPGSEGPRNNVSMLRDRAGRLWLADTNRLWRLNRDTDRFVPVVEPTGRAPGRWSARQLLAKGPGKDVVYATVDGLYRVDPSAETPVRLLRPTVHGLDEDWVRAVGSDSRGAIWFTQPGGLVRIDPITGRWSTLVEPGPDPGATFNSGQHAVDVAETPDGDVWLSGLFGLVRFDPTSEHFRVYRHDPDDPWSPPPTLGEVGYRTYVDRFGVLWVGGTLGGLARKPPHRERFVHVIERSPGTRSANVIRAIAEQTTPTATFVWTAAQNHGISVWRQDGRREYVLESRYPAAGDAAELGTVRALAVDPVDSGIWIAGGAGLARIPESGAPPEPVRFGGDDATTSLRSLVFVDETTLIFAGSLQAGSGLWRMDTRSMEIERIDAQPPEPRNSYALVFDLHAISSDRLAAATSEGLALIDLRDGSTRWHFPSEQPGLQPENRLFSLGPDGDGGFWIGTRGGGLLHARFPAEDYAVFDRYGIEAGLPDETVYAVLPSDQGSLWLSTNRGVARFNPDAGTVQRYTPSDGLQSWEFSHNVAHRGAGGRYYLGGINGWNAFEPAKIRNLTQPPEIDLSDLRINGRSIRPTEDRRLPSLAHDRNRLAIEFVGLHFAEPERIRYAYRLSGLEDEWVDAGASRLARYPDLTPGEYRFEIRAQNLDGIWSHAETLLEFEIRQPPWATPWAWTLYIAAAALLALALLARQRRARRQLESEVRARTAEVREQKDLVARQALELEQALAARTTLFANISHEFRTPLTLIRAGIDKLERSPEPEAAAMARKYINRLIRLVEQLMDLSRLGLTRSAEPQAPWRLDAVVSQTADAFRSVAEHRGLEIECRIDAPWQTTCQQDLVEKILLNLLGNAVKFTPPGGRVSVALEASGNHARLSVSDTGPGIEESDQARIFERFYRAGNGAADRQPGAGIGLALVFEAARAIGGAVRVDSRPGAGARFILTLPAVRASEGSARAPLDRERQQLDLALLDPREGHQSAFEPLAAPAPHAGTVLVVEDNADLRNYLAEALSVRWRVVEAENGEEGYELAREHDCDIIVSDLMMPRVDGFEMLRRLRLDLETSHIPVLFLTARQDNETRLRAFALSADAFLPKPFDLDELTTRLEQMIRHRERLREHIHRSVSLDAPPTAVESATVSSSGDAPELSERDRDFLAALDEWLAANHGNPDVAVRDLAGALHVTPRTLQRKLRSLADRTPAAYLRDYRMARARERLRETDQPVTEIAFEVGYASSQYFSRVFRQLHGEPPESWRQSNRRRSDASGGFG